MTTNRLTLVAAAAAAFTLGACGDAARPTPLEPVSAAAALRVSAGALAAVTVSLADARERLASALGDADAAPLRDDLGALAASLARGDAAAASAALTRARASLARLAAAPGEESARAADAATVALALDLAERLLGATP